MNRRTGYCHSVNSVKNKVMPIKKVKGGYKFGQSGKVFPTKHQAEAQMKAMYANGYKSNKTK